MKRNYKLYLNDIEENIDNINEFIGDIDYEDFIEDKKTSTAVVHCLEIIGEASKNIPLQIRQKYHYVDWSDMAKTRDKITHSYFRMCIARAMA